jgi:hypothetical protein
LGVPLGISSFTSSFIKDAPLNNVWHVEFFIKMSDFQVAMVLHNTNRDCLYVDVVSFVPWGAWILSYSAWGHPLMRLPKVGLALQVGNSYY